MQNRDQDRLTHILRLGASASVSAAWDALARYMDEPTPENYTALRRAYAAALEEHGANVAELEKYLDDDRDAGELEPVEE